MNRLLTFTLLLAAPVWAQQAAPQRLAVAVFATTQDVDAWCRSGAARYFAVLDQVKVDFTDGSIGIYQRIQYSEHVTMSDRTAAWMLINFEAAKARCATTPTTASFELVASDPRYILLAIALFLAGSLAALPLYYYLASKRLRVMVGLAELKNLNEDAMHLAEFYEARVRSSAERSRRAAAEQFSLTNSQAHRQRR